MDYANGLQPSRIKLKIRHSHRLCWPRAGPGGEQAERRGCGRLQGQVRGREKAAEGGVAEEITPP